MKKIQNISAFVFILCVAILATVSILGVWKVLDEDVISKSIQTVTLLAVVTIILTLAGNFFDNRSSVVSENISDQPSVPEINPAFTSIRHITLTVLILSLVTLALFGVLAIWDVLSGEVLSKSLSSMAILAFSSFIITLTCLQREQHRFMKAKISGFAILGLIILGWILLSTLLSF